MMGTMIMVPATPVSRPSKLPAIMANALTIVPSIIVFLEVI